MLKLLLVLVPTVILFGCRTSVPGSAGFATVKDRVTHSTRRPTYEDPFGQIQPQTRHAEQMAEPVGMTQTPATQQSPVQQATLTAPPESTPNVETEAAADLNPFAELPEAQPTPQPVQEQQTSAAPESTDTSWYSVHEEGATAVRDLSTTLAADSDSPGWKRSRQALSAN